jgi:hypothetical protein
MNILRKAIVATTLAATALVTTPAMAEHRDGRGGDTAAIAVGAGIVGIALGAIIASGNKRDRWDDRYYVRDGWYYNDGYYYNRSGHRHKRHDWERRYGNGYGWDRGDRGYRDGWNRGHRGDWNRGDRRRGHGDRYWDRRGY